MQPLKERLHAPNEEVGKKWSYRIKEEFLRFFGDLKVFNAQPRLFLLPHLLTTFPFRFTLLHDPSSYKVKGDDMRKAMSDLRPGDILVRGFGNYVDGYFIPGFFSHAGLYLGKVDEETIDRHWSSVLSGSAIEEGDYAPPDEVKERAVYGEQMVIHSMKDGIFMEDLLNFCRCDYLAAVRFPESVARAPDAAQPYSGKDDIKRAFSGEEHEILRRLENNEAVPFVDIFPVMFKLALSQLGKEYDFGLDFASFKKMSCTEFVYYCTKSLEWCSNVHPVTESVMGIKAPGISPDGFAGTPHLLEAFVSSSVRDAGIMKDIRSRYPGPYGSLSR